MQIDTLTMGILSYEFEFTPEGLKDVFMYPNLIYVLLKRGYTEEEIQKVCSGNVFRVWNKVIEVSEQSKI